jgi:hypothetical protein
LIERGPVGVVSRPTRVAFQELFVKLSLSSLSPSLSFALVLAACGPSSRTNVGPGGPDGGGGGCPSGQSTCPENTPATCSDGADNDGNGQIDCLDPSCSGVGSCPVCGTVQHPVSGGLALPDGVGSTTCTVPGGAIGCGSGELCYADPGSTDICRLPYTSKLNFTGFAAGQKLTGASNIQSVCVTIEHSWMRDLQIELVAPTGEVLVLDQFAGKNGGEVYFGQANDCDTDTLPVPGVGADYCWKPTATNGDMITVANTGALSTVTSCDPLGGGTAQELPPGDYAASEPWTKLVGATLNGDWELRVADLWPIDNGYIFKWSLSFDPSILENCSGPIIQ